jgi:hypothetical protein
VVKLISAFEAFTDEGMKAALTYYADMSAPKEVAHAALIAIQILIGDVFLVCPNSFADFCTHLPD